jgi:hypothetical protein
MSSEEKFITSQKKRILNASRVIKRLEAKTLPIHMIRRDTHELVTNTINNNKLINKLLTNINFNDKYNILINDINLKIKSTSSKFNYCISGSKSWYNIFKDYYDNNLLSEYEKSAIHNNNTCDHYYFINNNNTSIINEIKTYILEALKNFIITIEDELNANIKILENSNKQVQLLAARDNSSYNKLLFKDNTEIFSLTLIISDIVPQFKAPQPLAVQPLAPQPLAPQPKKTRTKRMTNIEKAAESEKEKKQMEDAKNRSKISRAERALLISAKREISLAATGAKKGGSSNIIKKKILGFEINFRNIGDDFIDKINDLIFPDSHYLNIYGLYLFLQFAKYKFFIKRDSYNVFKIREHIYNKLILIDEYKTNALFTILNLYNNIFSYSNNIFLYNELNKLALSSNPEIETFINNTEANIIECLRPYINQTIITINNNIKSLKFHNSYNAEKEGKDISGIFIAGGDAIRRYSYNASVTKDIDSKIYIPAEYDIYSNINNYIIINECIYKNLFKLASYLICMRNIIFRPLEYNLEKIFNSTEYNNYDCKVSFKLKSDNPDFLNFRFRQLPKNKFPVDLYSLDYRCIIKFEYKLKGSEEIKEYIHNYDIPFIDIVLEESQDNNYDKYAVISNNLPISSLDFLIQDLIKTYNNDISSLMRFINGKNTKDYDRFKLLVYIAKNKKLFTITTGTNNKKIITYSKESTIRNNEVLDNHINYEANILSINPTEYQYYLDLFNANYKYNKQERIKHKIVFDYEYPKSSRKGGSRTIKKYIFDKTVNFDYINKIENNYNIKSITNQIKNIEAPINIDNDITYFMTPNPKKDISLKIIEDIKTKLFKNL